MPGTLSDFPVLIFEDFAIAYDIHNQWQKSKSGLLTFNSIRPGLFSHSPGPRGEGAQRPGCQKSRLTSTD